MATAGDEPVTLQSRLEEAGDGEPGARPAHPAIADSVALLAHLDVSGHFHRDSRVGRVFHRGMISLRENVATDSLHVSLDGNRMTAHVDGVSPLALDSDSRSGYSLRRAVEHNVAGMARDVVWLVRGRQGDHSCVLNCEWDASDGAGSAHDPPLLDPYSAAWSVQLEARVAGALDETRLRAAVRAAAGSAEHDRVEAVDCPDDADLDAARDRLQRRPVAFSERPPFRVCLARHPAGDVVMLNVNHAAADGAGALRVLDAIATAYADGAAPREPLDFLAGRDLPVRPASPPTSLAARTSKRAIELLRDALSRTAVVAAEEPADEDGYGFHLVRVPAAETRRLAGVTTGSTGDLLLTALHLAVDDWNRAHGVRSGRIGILVPADLRPAEWYEDAIGNFSVTARVSTSRRERARPARASRAVAAQTARNERTRTGIALIAALRRAGLLALWAKQSTVVLAPLTSNRLVDAATLYNAGTIAEPPHFGEDAGPAVALWISMPARSPLSVCVGAVTAAGRLHLTFRYPRRVLHPDAARRFGERYLAQLRLVADG